MEILVLGGTRFLGRHIVERLAARGHRVTCFHRGLSTCELPGGVSEVLGDRNEPPPSALHRPWQAIVDVSGQLPEQVARTLELPAQWYLFISTLNVYADLSRTGAAESDATVTSFDPSDVAMAYGGRKAACERMVRERFGEGATIMRPGIIVGPWDYTGRFSYWPLRALSGSRFVVPLPRERPVQFVDARDLAAFVADAIERRITGTFNAAGPATPFTLGELVETALRCAQERGVAPGKALFIPPERLLAAGVEPWSDLPLWLEEQEFQGIFAVDNRAGLAAGMTYRAPYETVRAVMDWLDASDSPSSLSSA